VPLPFGREQHRCSLGPLSPFQSCIADENGTLKLVKDINKALNSPTDEGNLEETFKLFWNKLQAQLGEAKDTTDFKSQAPKRTAEEMSEEILPPFESYRGTVIRREIQSTKSWVISSSLR